MRKFILPLLLLLVSCVDDKITPEGALKAFVEARIGSVVSKDFVLERVTGRMKQSLENMPEEDFNKFADQRNINKDSFKVLSKSCQAEQCFVTYTIGFKTKHEIKPGFNSEVKKIAELNKVDGKWLIADVSNIKTYLEATEAINPLE